MLVRRVATTAVFLPILAVGLLTDFPGKIELAAVVAVSGVWGLSEFFNLGQRLGAIAPRLWIYFIAVGTPFLVHAWGAGRMEARWFWLWGVLAVVGAFAVLVVRGRTERAWESMLISMGGFVYVVLPLSLALAVRQWNHGEWFILYLLAVTWLSDTGAYAGGRLFGKTKLAPSISPGKTREGSVCGMILAVAGVAVCGLIQLTWTPEGDPARFFWTEGTAGDVATLCLLAAGLVVTGTFGDLLESMLKRDLGVKDSGSALTGHGGFLDIADSLLVNAPILFVYGMVYRP